MFFQEDEALEVVTGGFQVQDERRAHDPKAAHQFAAHLRQRAKYMLDAGAWRGDRAVAPFLRLGNTFACMAASLDVHAPASLLQPAFPFHARVAPIGIDIVAGIVQVEQLFENVGVRHGGVGDDDSTNQLATLVDTGMQLVAEVILAVLSGLLRVDILLRPLVRFPAQWHGAFLDRLGFLALVALNRRLH